MAKIYLGEENKFAINLQADGFSMDDNDFELEVTNSKSSVKGNKGNTLGDTGLRIFKEDTTWYGIIDTSKFTGSGELKVIATAFIPDGNADDGVRKAIAVGKLGDLSIL